MEADMSTAFLVLAVGMITVFVILGLVVLTGQILIRIVNAFFPITEAEGLKNVELSQPLPSGTFKNSTMAAIISAVDIVTKGKGRPDKIEKIN